MHRQCEMDLRTDYSKFTMCVQSPLCMAAWSWPYVALILSCMIHAFLVPNSCLSVMG